jgi:hypothetical protein
MALWAQKAHVASPGKRLSEFSGRRFRFSPYAAAEAGAASLAFSNCFSALLADALDSK